MAILEIRIYPDPMLTQKAKPVDVINDAIRQVLDEMAETMYDASGIGLAAPQVGRLVRAIVVDASPSVEGEKLIKLVNPVITFAEGSSVGEEGCLSLPGVSEHVTRAAKIVVDAYNEQGKPVNIETDTFLATVLQHEIDHLNGILFIDHLSRLKRDIIKRKLRKISYQKNRKRESMKEQKETFL
jgi:peptide deformylase